MKRSIITALAGVLGSSAGAWAANNTFQPGGSSGDWNVGGNWSDGVPDESDRVIVPAGKTCNVYIDTAVADTIEIASTGHLVIQPEKKITLDNDANVDSVINGDILLQDGGENPSGALAIIDHNHVVSGSGFIEGEAVTCKILIEMNKFFQNELANAGGGMRRGMKIVRDDNIGTSSPAYFNNFGTVTALERDTIWLASTVEIDDETDAEWQSIGEEGSGGGPLLKFDRQATGLSGNFRAIFCGGIRFNANIGTCGEFEYTDSYLQFGNSSTFKYALFDVGSSCGNPKVSGSGSCTTPISPRVVGPTDVSCATCGS